jgi:BirA family biotin operon repressor/biotin-[acetyl-CoA-carboxylase] ligase
MALVPPHDIFPLDTRRLGRQVWSFQLVDSTNTLALALADDGGNDGLVLLAQEQTAGRGQYGRSWTAPPGSSVLLSVLLFPPVWLRRPAMLTAWAAVSVCATIREVAGLEATIKWPNDVLVLGRKVCGILIEQCNSGAGAPPATVAGIGLNVRQSADFFASADLRLGASLASLSGRTLDTRFVAERLIGHLDLAYDRLLRGDTDTLEALWKERLGLVGEHVVVEMFVQRKEGRLLDIAWEGVLLEEAGQTVSIPPEMVRHITNCRLQI